MLYKIDGYMNMPTLIFKDSTIQVGDTIYKYADISGHEFKGNLFAAYNILILHMKNQQKYIPFDKYKKKEIEMALAEMEEIAHKKKETASHLPTEDLIALKDLLDRGILTQDEFDQKKKELLDL